MAITERKARDKEEIALTASAATSGVIPLSGFAGGIIMLDSVSAGGDATIKFHVKGNHADSTTYLLQDASGNDVTRIVAAGQACELPTELFGAGWVIPVVGSGTAAGWFVLKG
jgi:hypothetical protein